MRLINADRLVMELLHLWRYFLERKRAKETMIIWTVITRVNEMAEEETWKHELSKERQRTANARPTHECVKPTHECVDIISRDKVLNLVLGVCNDVMDECETVTGICGEEVYTDVREVDAILKCNKRIRNGIRQLPSEQLDRTCAKCKLYTADGICVQWSRYGFREEDYCSRWEGRK